MGELPPALPPLQGAGFLSEAQGSQVPSSAWFSVSPISHYIILPENQNFTLPPAKQRIGTPAMLCSSIQKASYYVARAPRGTETNVPLSVGRGQVGWDPWLKPSSEGQALGIYAYLLPPNLQDSFPYPAVPQGGAQPGPEARSPGTHHWDSVDSSLSLCHCSVSRDKAIKTEDILKTILYIET